MATRKQDQVEFFDLSEEHAAEIAERRPGLTELCHDASDAGHHLSSAFICGPPVDVARVRVVIAKVAALGLVPFELQTSVDGLLHLVDTDMFQEVEEALLLASSCVVMVPGWEHYEKLRDYQTSAIDADIPVYYA